MNPAIFMAFVLASLLTLLAIAANPAPFDRLVERVLAWADRVTDMAYYYRLRFEMRLAKFRNRERT